MPRLPTTQLTRARAPRTGYSLHSRILARYSSRSPSQTSTSADQFNKTGEKEASDPTKINIRSDEYSKSGGDDIVAEQTIASFQTSTDTDPASQKERAGKGNVINPLDVSPATPEVSKIIEETYVEKNAERDPNAKTGKGVTKKAKKVEHVEIDFSKIKMRGR